MKYKWKHHGIAGVGAQTVGKELNRLIEENQGQVKPLMVVNAARPRKSPLHSCFDWNDKSAAEKYRQEQAKYLLRAIVVVEEHGNSEPLEVRAFVSVPDDNKLVYTTVQRAFANPVQANHVLQTAYDELQAWRHKYKNLQLFKKVYDAIDKIEIP